MTTTSQDSVDLHVAHWAALWERNPGFNGEVEAAMSRMQLLLRTKGRRDAAAFAGQDCTREDYSTLHELMVQPCTAEATPTQLAKAVGVTKASMTGRLDRLERSGMITRETDSNNRRRVLVRPTQAGRAAWESHVDAGMRRDQEILGALSQRDLVQLNALLRKAVRGLQ